MVGVIFGFIVLAFAGFYYISQNLCDSTDTTYRSPDGSHMALYREYNCGAISEDFAQIYLNKEVVRVRLGGVSVKWTDNSTLRVEYSGPTVIKLLKEDDGVKVDFVNISNYP